MYCSCPYVSMCIKKTIDNRRGYRYANSFRNREFLSHTQPLPVSNMNAFVIKKTKTSLSIWTGLVSFQTEMALCVETWIWLLVACNCFVRGSFSSEKLLAELELADMELADACADLSSALRSGVLKGDFNEKVSLSECLQIYTLISVQLYLSGFEKTIIFCR